MDFHDRRNTRLANHDYSQPCSYFITINIRFGQCLFGRALSPGEIGLNELGQTAQKFWLEIPEHFNHVSLGEFVVMPNHFHGIIHIGEINGDSRSQPFPDKVVSVKRMKKTYSSNQFGPQVPGSLAVVIGQYKSSVTRWANQNKFGALFTWQARFYDRILNDQESLMAAKYYIRNNPAKWWQKYEDRSW